MKLDMDRVLELAEESMFGMADVGICVKCGEEQYGVEPDARRYTCESCGGRHVYGAQELMYHFVGL